MQNVIDCQDLGKKYIIAHSGPESYTALRDVLARKSKQLFRRAEAGVSTREEFWALKDVSFQVNKGDAIGIIGRNGAGKSTLLKVLSRITEPSKGRLEINGRIASLLEVGTGFHPELTGRENIFLNGAILGMTRQEIRNKFDEIVSFSEVERFLDTPVKRYSSGMYVKLAFAVAAHLEPEILVVDEVLAVGDIEFQKKCLGKMDDVARTDGATILFVSHNMQAIQQFCNRGILLQNGKVAIDGSVDDAISGYLRAGEQASGSWTANSPKSSELYLSFIGIELTGEQPAYLLRVTVKIRVNRKYPKACLAYYIASADGIPLMEAIPRYDFIESDTAGAEATVITEIRLPPMIPGGYTLGVWLGQNHTATLDWQKDVVRFDIVSSPVRERTVEYPRHSGFIVPPSTILDYQPNS